MERLFGYPPRFVIERLRVAQALETLPALSEALGDGRLSWSAVRELVRVAVPDTDTESRRLDAAAGKSVREIERLVSGLEPGALPGAAPSPAHERRVLRFEVSTWALVRDALAGVQREAGEPLDADAQLQLLARRALGGPRDDGRAGYQVALTVCERCKQGWADGRGERVAVSEDVVEMAECDGQRFQAESTHVGRASQSIPPATRRLVMQRDGGRCVVPGCRHAVWVDVHSPAAARRGWRARSGCAGGPVRRAPSGAPPRHSLRGGHRLSGLTFLHADGTAYGAAAVAPAQAGAAADAFTALRQLGFAESDVRRTLVELAGRGLEAGARRASPPLRALANAAVLRRP